MILVADPFDLLGLAPTASSADVRAARRRLAKRLHPDHGGDISSMQDVNRAFELAMRAVRDRAEVAPTAADVDAADVSMRATERSRGHEAHDAADVPRAAWWIDEDRPSFTIDALPVVAFEALLEVALRIGDVVADDSPYLFDVELRGAYACTCRVELVPDAGSSTVSLTVMGADREHWPPAAEAVRDLWISELNAPPDEDGR